MNSKYVPGNWSVTYIQALERGVAMRRPPTIPDGALLFHSGDTIPTNVLERAR